MILKKTFLILSLIVSFTLLSKSAFSKPSANTSCLFNLKNIKDTLPVSDSTIAQKIYETVEVEAYFAGGEASWRSYLEHNLNPATPVDNGAPAGLYTVYIQFIVSIDGKISNVKPLTKHGYGMEAEVMRIIRKAPLWVPAIQNGRPVNAYRKQPVTS